MEHRSLVEASLQEPLDGDHQDLTEVQIVARRIQFAEGFSLLYALMLVLQTGLLIWGVYFHFAEGRPNEEGALYITLDVIVTLVLCLEVVVRMLATPKYFKSCLNWIDVIVSFLSVVCLFLYVVGTNDALVLGLIGPTIRYLMQLIRVSSVLRNWIRRQRDMRASAETLVDFSDLPQETIHGSVEQYFAAERTELQRTPSLLETSFQTWVKQTPLGKRSDYAEI